MEWDTAAKILGALSPVLVAVLGLIAQGAVGRSREASLKNAVELLKLLPEQSESRQLLETRIERTIVRLTEDDDKRREPFGIVLALLFLGFAGWTWVLALDGSNWWVALAISLTVLGVGGFTLDASRAKRDERGRRIR